MRPPSYGGGRITWRIRNIALINLLFDKTSYYFFWIAGIVTTIGAHPRVLIKKETAMKKRDNKPASVSNEKEALILKARDTISRREFLIDAAVVSATVLLPGGLFAATEGKKTFTILHTNDMHSSFIGMG